MVVIMAKLDAIRGVRCLTSFRAARLQSAPVADNPRYSTV